MIPQVNSVVVTTKNGKKIPVYIDTNHFSYYLDDNGEEPALTIVNSLFETEPFVDDTGEFLPLEWNDYFVCYNEKSKEILTSKGNLYPEKVELDYTTGELKIWRVYDELEAPDLVVYIETPLTYDINAYDGIEYNVLDNRMPRLKDFYFGTNEDYSKNSNNYTYIGKGYWMSEKDLEDAFLEKVENSSEEDINGAQALLDYYSFATTRPNKNIRYNNVRVFKWDGNLGKIITTGTVSSEEENILNFNNVILYRMNKEKIEAFKSTREE